MSLFLSVRFKAKFCQSRATSAMASSSWAAEWTIAVVVLKSWMMSADGSSNRLARPCGCIAASIEKNENETLVI